MNDQEKMEESGLSPEMSALLDDAVRLLVGDAEDPEGLELLAAYAKGMNLEEFRAWQEEEARTARP